MSRELCIMACVFCRSGGFHDWAREQIRDRGLVLKGGRLSGPGESIAKTFILHVCQVSSRNDLDTDPDAAARFHEHIRKPYMAWKEVQP